ncbi:uroporphyrinogen-III C-methyltransferase [Legionella jordanis]|uniref:uroporphyrinogen-III C-methyltransferase n=1 Tax=Legionella jordanis TaxID=456 RepID=UPI0013EFAB28|nr:uroporphyrinogen-III C-methyltransferase [Legionella jordanis]
MLLLALGFAFYALKLIHEQKTSTQQELAHVNTELDNLKRQQQGSSDTLNQLQELKQSFSQLENRLKMVQDNAQTALRQASNQKEDWLLLKARYYLELAQINSHWSGDHQVSIAMLQGADTLLSNLNDQPLFTIRQAIAQEVAQLKALPRVDVTGLLSQLDAAEDSLANLPLKQPLNQPMKANQTKNSSSAWREQLRESLNSLEQLIVIRRHDENIQPLLSPIQLSLLQESIRLYLEEAQWAVLQNNNEIYQFALEQAIKNIKRGFDEQAAATQALLQQLQHLKQKQLFVSKAKLDKALPLLNQYIEDKASSFANPQTKEGEPLQ